MAVVNELFAAFCVDAVGKSAKLSTGTAVGAATGGGKTSIALAGIAHAERSVDKVLNSCRLQRFVALSNFIEIHLTSKHYLGKSRHFLRIVLFQLFAHHTVLMHEAG